MKATLKSYHNFNFFKHTYCEFEKAREDFFLKNEVHYKSKSGSKYFYTKEGVYRYSNHWGRVANCRWKISGIEDYKNQNYYIGYANWLDFHPLNNFEKVFYIVVDEISGKSTIYRIKENDATKHFLMTLNLAQQRLKQIKKLFKDYKWAMYYNASVDIVRSKLVTKLINSDKALQELKQQLKNDF